MCGFLVYKKNGNNIYIKKRGPDFTRYIKINNLIFVHNLLSITGEFIIQPFIEDEIICVYNGEIYKLNFTKTDGENIIKLYKKYGEEFTRHLDGEFSIALYDFKNNTVILSTDIFGTKPLWYNGIEAASYKSGIGIGKKIPANTTILVNLKTLSEKTFNIYKFDLTQYKDTYSDWITSFQNSIKKRAKSGCFIGLSSGYDSGAIACELTKQKIEFKSYVINFFENYEVIKKRKEILKNTEIINNFDIKQQQNYINENIEDFEVIFKIEGQIIKRSFKKTETSALALSHIFSLAKKENRRIYLSGQGADEILSDYSLFPKQSELKGLFPDNLDKLWFNFLDGCQTSYLMKEEYTAGSHGIETRYPFLDKELVQEFLWLKPQLKNKNYKAPLYEYFEKNKFPYDKGKKIGFTVKI